MDKIIVIWDFTK